MDLDHSACYRALCTRDPRFDGRIFIAVKTTGIYCRPICPARTPRSENVIFFVSAAAAQEAGFRPCLRCRPETAPDLGAWRGSSNTVSRALSLIEGGALDGADVETFAGRLGLGERQLRRLFKTHIGASPVAVAQTRRVLLAKQLIDETQLPMSEIALAAGFGSIRRFNEAFQQLFRQAPSDLRRRSADGNSAAARGEVTILLRYRPPYDWDAMLGYLRARAIPSVEAIANGSYSRTIELNGVRGTVTVRYHDETALRATVRFPKLSALPTIIARLRRTFDLAADPEAIGDHLAEDGLLEPLVRMRPGLRVPGAWDGFELAVRALLGQQITVVAAVGLAEKLVMKYGAPVEGVPVNGLTRAFPAPGRLAEAHLSSLGLPQQRAAAISALAAAILDEPDIFGPQKTLDEAIGKLRELPGVGDWTAHYIAMRELREPDAFPAADVGLLRAMAALEGRCRSPAEVLKRSEAWRPWRAYAAQHLWTSLSTTPSKRSSASKSSGHPIMRAEIRQQCARRAIALGGTKSTWR
jgi:AraC family transcriptional regulator, regulatory protein of adaptative response / DNA-3-methyladenine glycosylase II